MDNSPPATIHSHGESTAARRPPVIIFFLLELNSRFSFSASSTLCTTMSLNPSQRQAVETLSGP
ncbi:MAG TPA: hypothetical protein VGJ04_06960, partial [Pirellulales bacterium]